MISIMVRIHMFLLEELETILKREEKIVVILLI